MRTPKPSKISLYSPPIAVLAGNYREFEQWCRENHMVPGQDAICIDGSERSRGFEFEEFVRVGTWMRADWCAAMVFKQLSMSHRIKNGLRTSKAV